MEEELEKLYINMENELLLNIAKKLAQGKPMEIDKYDLETQSPIVGSGGVNEWQLERLKEIGGLTEENAKKIAEYSGKTIDEVNKIFERAREIGTEVDKDILSMGIKAGILNEVDPFVEDAIIKGIVSAGARTVLTTLNAQNNSLLASAGNEYRQIINKVSTQVLGGTKTTAKAMQEAVSDLATRGLTGFIARNGAEWTPEAYTKMLIRSNTQNTINQIQEERLTKRGGDYVEISQHVGARPLCSEDQGQIFSLSGNTEPIEDGNGRKIKVRAWSDSTYGKPAGILGINCRHSRHGFVPGISIFRSEPIDKEENDRMYKERQQQRQYERNIRNKKREIEMLKTTNAETEYIAKRRKQLTEYRKEYLEFLDKTGRTRVTSNEWIGTTAMSSKAKEKTTSAYNSWKNKTSKSITKKVKTVTKNKVIKLTDDEKYAINKYVGFESYIYNEKLRNNIELTKEETKILNNLDSALSKMPKYNGTVTRSVSINSEDIDYFLKRYEVGKVTTENAYTSTTIGSTYNPDARIQMTIKSINGRDIIKYNPDEQEILFEKNSKFKVKKIDKTDNFYVKIFLEEVE